MIVGICGYGNSGASAVIDFLKQYDEVKVYDFILLHSEFQIIHEVDGINDLKYHLTKSCDRIACNTAIKRFKRLLERGKWGNGMRSILGEKYDKWCKSFLGDIVISSWKGKCSSFDAEDIRNDSKFGRIKYFERKIDKFVIKLNRKWNYPPKQVKYFSLFTERDFDDIVKKHLNNLFSLLSVDNSKINIFDQLFSCAKASLGSEFIDGVKTIVVVRDPRDIYVTTILHQDYSRFMPNSDVKEYIKYYRALNSFIETSDNTLIIQYEDMIYKYEKTCRKILDFLGLNNRPQREFELYNPLVSVKYTNRVALYEQVINDISVIEKELPEFLYDFKSSKNPKNDPILVERAKSVSYTGWNVK